MNFSYWENQELIGKVDLAVVGSGITGLSTAIHFKRANPKANVIILERGMFPWGASTKNAGFACFGSLGEIISDLEHTPLKELIDLVKFRNDGLKTLKSLIPASKFDLQGIGSFELFTPNQKEEFEECVDRLQEFNQLLRDEFEGDVYAQETNTFGFDNVHGIIKNNFEGQINTGLLMKEYLQLAKNEGIQILNGCAVKDYHDNGSSVSIELEGGPVMTASQLAICSNGFAKDLLKDDVKPARAQVIITKPIEDLPFEGTFHYEQGYYYFRNIHNRVLLGGGRNLDFEGETTTEMECSDLILNKLTSLLNEVILPNTKFEIDYNWAGIMGVGTQKNPIIKALSDNVFCAVRLGGMGVAVGTSVGKQCATMMTR